MWVNRSMGVVKGKGPGPVRSRLVQDKCSSEAIRFRHMPDANSSPPKIDSFRLEFQEFLPQLCEGTIDRRIGAFHCNIKIPHGAGGAKLAHNIGGIPVEKTDECGIFDFTRGGGVRGDCAEHEILSRHHGFYDNLTAPSFR